MDETNMRFERTEEETFIDEVSDEALEAAGSATRQQITFSFSYNLFNCRFC
jgi:hypothetical protein